MNVKEKMLLSGGIIVLSLMIGIISGIMLWKRFGESYKAKHPGRVESVNHFIAVPTIIWLVVGILLVIKIGEL